MHLFPSYSFSLLQDCPSPQNTFYLLVAKLLLKNDELVTFYFHIQKLSVFPLYTGINKVQISCHGIYGLPRSGLNLLFI